MPALTRRDFTLGGACLAGAAVSAEPPRREVSVISAPLSLGLRPGARGQEPGSWRAPEVLLAAGLAENLAAPPRPARAPPPYDFRERRDTRIRNGDTLQGFLVELGDRVQAELAAGRFPLV